MLTVADIDSSLDVKPDTSKAGNAFSYHDVQRATRCTAVNRSQNLGVLQRSKIEYSVRDILFLFFFNA